MRQSTAVKLEKYYTVFRKKTGPLLLNVYIMTTINITFVLTATNCLKISRITVKIRILYARFLLKLRSGSWSKYNTREL